MTQLNLVHHHSSGDISSSVQVDEVVANPLTLTTGLTAGALNADLVPSTDVGNYSFGVLQVTGTFSGTLTFQASNDNTNFVSVFALNETAGYATTTTTTGMFIIPLGFKYLRVRMTSYTSGTATGVITYSDEPMPMPTLLALTHVGTTAIVNGGVNGCQGMAGAIAHDSVGTSSYPVKTGGRAVSSLYTAVSSGDVADFIATLVGAQVVRQNSIPENDVSGLVTLTTTTATAVLAAAGSGLKNYVTGVVIQNTSATATTVTLQDGSTNRLTINCPASMAAPVVISYGGTPLFTTTANTAVNAVCGTTGANVYINIAGYKAP